MISSESKNHFKRLISNFELPKENTVHTLSVIATFNAIQTRAVISSSRSAFYRTEYLAGSSYAVMDFERYCGSWQDQRVELSYKKMTEHKLSTEEQILLDVLNRKLNKNIKTQLPDFMKSADNASDFIEAYLAKKSE